MRSFEVPAMAPIEFVAAIRTRLAAKEYDRYVSVGLRGDELSVELDYMGKTRFDYRLIPAGKGFRAELVHQRISPFHAVFQGRFEGAFEDALAKVGATVV